MLKGTSGCIMLQKHLPDRGIGIQLRSTLRICTRSQGITHVISQRDCVLLTWRGILLQDPAEQLGAVCAPRLCVREGKGPKHRASVFGGRGSAARATGSSAQREQKEGQDPAQEGWV